MNQKHYQNIYRANVNVNLMVQHVIQIKSGIQRKWNKELCRCECENPRKYHVCEEDYVWNPSNCACKIDKYLENIIGDLLVTSDGIIDVAIAIPTKTFSSIFNGKKGLLQRRKFQYFTCLFINYHITVDNC